MEHSRSLCAVLLVMLAITGDLSSQSFFSVDSFTDELVQIDSASGHVIVIGSLGFDAVGIDLASVGSRLYAIDSMFQVGVDLHELDTTTGASSSSVLVAAGAITSVEGLAQVNGQLKIGYSTGGTFSADGLADLALDGSVANIQSNPAVDMDGLGADPVTGTLYGFDRDPPSGFLTFFDVVPAPLSINVFSTISSTFAISDVAIHGSTLYAIDGGNQQLHALDLNTLLFSSVDLDRPGAYQGLANADPPTWQDLAGGTTGSAGTPTLTGSGTLVGGSSASISLTNAPPGAVLLAWVSFAPTPFMALDGTVHAFPFATQFIFNANGAGAFMATTTWPAGVPAGAEVWFQFFAQDASSIHGITLSNGLLATTP